MPAAASAALTAPTEVLACFRLSKYSDSFMINDRLSKLADGNRVRFLDINDKLADGDGRLFDGIANDKLHPTIKGYQIWADALKPIFAELLGPPAREDHALHRPAIREPGTNR